MRGQGLGLGSKGLGLGRVHLAECGPKVRVVPSRTLGYRARARVHLAECGADVSSIESEEYLAPREYHATPYHVTWVGLGLGLGLG